MSDTQILYRIGSPHALYHMGAQAAPLCDGAGDESSDCTATATWMLRGGRRYPVSIYLCDEHADDEVRRGAVKAGATMPEG